MVYRHNRVPSQAALTAFHDSESLGTFECAEHRYFGVILRGSRSGNEPAQTSSVWLVLLTSLVPSLPMLPRLTVVSRAGPETLLNPLAQKPSRMGQASAAVPKAVEYVRTSSSTSPASRVVVSAPANLDLERSNLSSTGVTEQWWHRVDEDFNSTRPEGGSGPGAGPVDGE